MPDVAPIDRLAQQSDAVAAADPDPADRPRRIRPAAYAADRARGITSTDPANRARWIRSTANPADRAGGITSANPADRAGGIRSSSHDATSYFMLFRGQRLHELLDYFRRDLGALHQLAAGIHDGLAEIGDPQVLPQEQQCR